MTFILQNTSKKTVNRVDFSTRIRRLRVKRLYSKLKYDLGKYNALMDKFPNLEYKIDNNTTLKRLKITIEGTVSK